ATFQLVPLRWPLKTGIMTGIIGAAGGIGGFYLPVILGIAKEETGTYHLGFACFALLATTALGLVLAMRRHWLPWSQHAVVAPAVVSSALQSATAMSD
ncbi:MAG: MFS transporter, partial [Acidithiobacillus sp.]